MKKLFFVFYTSCGKEHIRDEYATTGLIALNQAKEHFAMFGYGDESNIEIWMP